MQDDSARSVRVAKTVVMTLGFVLIALGIAASGALLLFLALARGGRDWAGSGTAFTVFAVAAGWTVLAGGSAVWSSRRTRSRTIWLAGLPCVALGAVPTAFVAVGLLFLLPRQDRRPQDLSAASAVKMPVSRKSRHWAGDSLCRAR